MLLVFSFLLLLVALVAVVSVQVETLLARMVGRNPKSR